MDAIKILIVDDIQANLISLEFLLQEYFDEIKIIKANNGEEALKLSMQERMDLIILDIQMPGMDGFEVATLLKANRRTKDAPIIFLTAAFKDEEFQKRGFDVGAVDYLTKPIEKNKLLNKLKLYIEIFKKNKELRELLEENKKQKEILQSILDAEHNLTLVTDFKGLFIVNQAFLDFFGANDAQEIKQTQSSTMDLIIEKNEVFAKRISKELSEREKFHKALEITQSLREEERVIALEDKDGDTHCTPVWMSLMRFTKLTISTCMQVLPPGQNNL